MACCFTSTSNTCLNGWTDGVYIFRAQGRFMVCHYKIKYKMNVSIFNGRNFWHFLVKKIAPILIEKSKNWNLQLKKGCPFLKEQHINTKFVDRKWGKPYNILQNCLKVFGLTILEGLCTTNHSLAWSHYWPTRELLAAGFPLWPVAPLIKQPDPLELLQGGHVDASLSADANSTWIKSK